MVLPLQKLIHLHSDSDYDSDCLELENEHVEGARPTKNKKKKREMSFRSFLSSPMKTSHPNTAPPKPLDTSADTHDPARGFIAAHVVTKAPISYARTLQRYHGGPNEERIDFMEKHSALASKNLGVAVEQVSIFLTSDNTVISFFESSAEDIETPITARLSSQETILRRSSDASMLAQVGGLP